MIHVIQRFVRVGEKYQIMVGIEAGLNHPLYSNQRIAELIERVPSDYLGIIYDPTNLITAKTAADQVALVEEAFTLFGENRLLAPKGFSILGRRGDPCPVRRRTNAVSRNFTASDQTQAILLRRARRNKRRWDRSCGGVD